MQVRGEPSPNIRWYKDGEEITDDTPRFATISIGNTCRLVITTAIQSDSGRFVCEATNKIGRASTFTTLHIVTDPRILEADEKLKR